MKYINLLLGVSLLLGFTACDDDDPSGETCVVCLFPVSESKGGTNITVCEKDDGTVIGAGEEVDLSFEEAQSFFSGGGTCK